MHTAAAAVVRRRRGGASARIARGGSREPSDRRQVPRADVLVPPQRLAAQRSAVAAALRVEQCRRTPRNLANIAAGERRLRLREEN